MGLRWHVSLPGPFSVSGPVGRSKRRRTVSRPSKPVGPRSDLAQFLRLQTYDDFPALAHACVEQYPKDRRVLAIVEAECARRNAELDQLMTE